MWKSARKIIFEMKMASCKTVGTPLANQILLAFEQSDISRSTPLHINNDTFSIGSRSHGSCSSKSVHPRDQIDHCRPEIGTSCAMHVRALRLNTSALQQQHRVSSRTESPILPGSRLYPVISHVSEGFFNLSFIGLGRRCGNCVLVSLIMVLAFEASIYTTVSTS